MSVKRPCKLSKGADNCPDNFPSLKEIIMRVAIILATERDPLHRIHKTFAMHENREIAPSLILIARQIAVTRCSFAETQKMRKDKSSEASTLD